MTIARSLHLEARKVVARPRAEHQNLCNRRSAGGSTRLPDEVGAVAAESRLLEESCYKFMVLHFVDILLPQSTFAGEPIRHVRGGERLV